MNKEKLQKTVIEDIYNTDHSEKIFSNQYPDSVRAVREYLNEYIEGCNFNDGDLIVIESKLSVDDDGYPRMDDAVLIKPVDTVVNIIAYHHKSEWDFYLEDTRTHKKDL